MIFCPPLPYKEGDFLSAAYDRTGVKKIVIHHLGSGIAPVETAAELIRRANPAHPGYPNGYDYPEYDFGVLANGEIVSMRPLTVIGAHAVADKNPYDMYGYNWWNCNSASIVLGMDASAYAVPTAMMEGLISFLLAFMKDRQFGLEGVYPHNQIFHTDCPGFNYSVLETELKQRMEVKPVTKVLFFGPDDLVLARRVAEKVGGVLAPRSMAANLPAGPYYIVGGPVDSGAVANITGGSFEDTCAAYVSFMKG